MMDLVTVVIPVYNTEAYLDRCVESVVNQTCRNLQILLIDDGSTDHSGKRCDQWAEQDKRITVIHKKNEGLGMARNTGLAYAAGRYICFLDSDDCLQPDAVETARRECKDVVFYGFQSMDERGTLREIRKPGERKIFSGNTVQTEFLPKLIGGEAGLQPSVCWAMFSMDLVRRANWQFPSEREMISEDIYALLELFPDIKEAAVLPEALYCYRENRTSLSRHYREDRFEQASRFYLQTLTLCDKLHYPAEVSQACSEPFLSLTILALKQACSKSEIQRILRSPVLRRALQGRHPGTWKRRLLLLTIRRHRLWLCRILLAVQRWKEKRT